MRAVMLNQVLELHLFIAVLQMHHVIQPQIIVLKIVLIEQIANGADMLYMEELAKEGYAVLTKKVVFHIGILVKDKDVMQCIPLYQDALQNLDVQITIVYQPVLLPLWDGV